MSRRKRTYEQLELFPAVAPEPRDHEVLCFFDPCTYVERHPEFLAAHDAMEQHYEADHRADVDQFVARLRQLQGT